ncbi:uncharacterized protein LOC143365580 isoform X2 [Halictus rubicundus]|uniref:uncharacterized protein LOC143365580 isoform X2 n=1 Tax=Halictus rubicundus TaxID=77578 RepID=UPI0040370B46
MSMLVKLTACFHHVICPYESEDTIYNVQNYYGEILLSDYLWRTCYQRKRFGLYEKFIINSGYIKYYHKCNDRGDAFHYQRYFSHLEFILCQR